LTLEGKGKERREDEKCVRRTEKEGGEGIVPPLTLTENARESFSSEPRETGQEGRFRWSREESSLALVVEEGCKRKDALFLRRKEGDSTGRVILRQSSRRRKESFPFQPTREKKKRAFGSVPFSRKKKRKDVAVH